MIVTTTSEVPGYRVAEILGIVREGSHGSGNMEAMIKKAAKLGADAVVGVGMAMTGEIWSGAVFYGTAVRLEKDGVPDSNEVDSKDKAPTPVAPAPRPVAPATPPVGPAKWE